jgi:uncharacterized protein DUF6933
VFTLRCTKILLKRLKVRPDPSPPLSTTVLGEWYANLLFTRPKHLVLCVSERTLLPVLVEAADTGALAHRLRDAVTEVLRKIGVPDDRLRAEETEMSESVTSTTASRQVLGSMNDFAYLLEAYRERSTSLLEVALHMADAPCSPIGMNSPRRATIELFSKPRLRLVE